jgi:GMP synthase (glutamine-hydrolysing)
MRPGRKRHAPRAGYLALRLLIIDFGSQVTQLIARRLRELNVYCEIHPYQNVTDAFLKDFAPKAIIFSGGPDSVTRPDRPVRPASAFDHGRADPWHLLWPAGDDAGTGRAVESGHGTAEFGRAYVTPPMSAAAAGGLVSDGREQVWMSHGDHVSKIAPGFQVYGTSPGAPFAITADPARSFYAVQFHPEVHHTPRGAKLYENFVRWRALPATGPWPAIARKRSARSANRSATRR